MYVWTLQSSKIFICKKLINFYITRLSINLEACSNKYMLCDVNQGLRKDIFFKFAMFIRMWTGFSPMVFFNQSNSLRNCSIACVRIDIDDLCKVDGILLNGNKQFACHMGNDLYRKSFCSLQIHRAMRNTQTEMASIIRLPVKLKY